MNQVSYQSKNSYSHALSPNTRAQQSDTYNPLNINKVLDLLKNSLVALTTAQIPKEMMMQSINTFISLISANNA